ncbi:MAG: T9SS type A sorting domain-containing protein [Candidatus Kapaibacterium sp.]
MKLLKLFIVCFVLLFFSTKSNAQLLVGYTASEGLETAINFTKNDLSFKNPKLTAVATMNQELDMSGFTLKAGMNVTNGKSEAWAYAIMDEGTEETAIIGVVKLLFAFQALNLSGQSGFEIPGFVTEPISLKWRDSKVLVDDLSANATYQNYIKNNPEAEPQTTALSINTFNPLFKMDYPYWVNTFGIGESFVCYTDAVTGETDCLTLSNVKPMETVSNTFSPNPANNYINLKFDNITNLESIRIVDSFGNIVFETRNLENIRINTDNLASGSYTIIYDYRNRFETEKLLIQK